MSTREPLRSSWHRLLHVAVVLAGWVVFIYWWYLVSIDDWNRTDVALIIFVTLVVSPVITIGWVLHNLGIFRRKGPRMGQPPVSLDYTRDWNGRTIAADWEALRTAGLVVVTVEGDSKRYSAVAVAEPTAAVVESTGTTDAGGEPA